MAILSLKSISRSFDGIRAVDNLSLAIEKARITALIGPNGSGKTTVFNIVTGLIPADSGSVSLDGTVLSGLPPHKVARAGIGRTFQLIRLCPQMTVLENVMLALRHRVGERLTMAMLRPKRLVAEENENRERAIELLQSVEMDHKKSVMGNELSHGQRRLVEIARALALDPRVLLLDEPTSGLYPQMIRKVTEIVRALRDDGRTIWFIEHNMKVVLELSDRVIVLDHGRKLIEGTPDEIKDNPEVNTAYLGRSRIGVA